MGVDARMLVGVQVEPSLQEVRRWGYLLGEAVGHEHFLWDHIGDSFSQPYRSLMLEAGGEEYPLSDGLLDADRAGNAAFIRVSLMGRYYGPGYERGDLWVYVAVAEWCERNIPSARVYYGGDSDDRLRVFDRTAREALIRHWAEHGGRPYSGAFDRRDVHPLRPTCPFCEEPASQFGYGGNYAAWTCLGCGQGWTWIGGETVHPRPYRMESFTHADQLRNATVVRDAKH